MWALKSRCDARWRRYLCIFLAAALVFVLVGLGDVYLWEQETFYACSRGDEGVQQDVASLQLSGQTKGTTLKPVAIVTVITRLGQDETRFFASVSLFMPETTVFVSCTTAMSAKLRALASPTLRLKVFPNLDFYANMDRNEMTQRGLWVEFNSRRVDILRAALMEGHDGAWYLDTDTFLLSPLPWIDANVGLSRHRIRPDKERTYGEWNSGCVFFRSFHILRTWERAGQALAIRNNRSGVHQITLRSVARCHAHEMVEVGCSVNVGKYRMDPRSHYDAKPRYNGVQCKAGVPHYFDCPIVLGHWHSDDTEVRPYMEAALRECNHPFLKAWLKSYR